MTRAQMVKFLLAQGLQQDDLDELSDEEIIDQYETERAELDRIEEEDRYRRMRPTQRIQAGIAQPADVATVLSDYLRDRGVPLRDLSAASYYLGNDDAKIRVSDHDPRPTYERAFGRADVDVNTSPLPRHNATHEAGTKSVSELKTLAGEIADWYEERTTDDYE